MDRDSKHGDQEAVAAAWRPATIGAAYLAGALSLAVGVAHGMVVPEYLGEWWGYGFFFLWAALAQIAYGLVLFLRPWAYDDTGGGREDPDAGARPVYRWGAFGNAAIIALYVVTRTAGIPLLGPGAGRAEPVTVLSLTVTLLETALVATLLLMAQRKPVVPADPLVVWEVDPDRS